MHRYATSLFAEINGCNMTQRPVVSFKNGTKRNTTVCHTWSGCDANVTTCLSDAGHTWFGDTSNGAEVCPWEYGPNSSYCLPHNQTYDQTFSIHETAQTLAFFDNIIKTSDDVGALVGPPHTDAAARG